VPNIHSFFKIDAMFQSQKVLWNAEQIQVVGYIEKKIMFQEKIE